MVGHVDIDPEQGGDRAQQALDLSPGTTERKAQQVTSLDRHARVVAGATVLTRAGRLPGRKRLGRRPDRQASALLQRPVVLRPVDDLVAHPGELVAARLIGLVGRRLSEERESGLCARLSHGRLAEAAQLHLSLKPLILRILPQLGQGLRAVSASYRRAHDLART